MALIGTIRKRGWILIVMMALALGGFILMDVMSNTQRYSAADANSLGKVGEVEIKRSEFDTYEKLVYSEQQRDNTYQIRSQAWTYFMEKAIVDQQAEEIGIGVCTEELMDLQFGLNLSPIIVERFKNEAGQPDRAKLASIKNAIEQGQFTDPQGRAYWAVQEKEVVKTRLQDKILNAVAKGMYTPKWQAEAAFRENNDRRDFCAVRIAYEKIKDEEAPLEESDYKAFLKENPHWYDQTEASRLIAFASFDVVPTKSDSLAAYESVAKMVDGLRNAPNDSLYAIANGGAYNGLYIPRDKFPGSLADSVLNRPAGTIVGPLMSEGAWTIVKVVDRKVLPDSVKARHILLRDATPENSARADSLIALIRSGNQRFDSLAVKASQDPGSGRLGGDLGWFANGMMVVEFNNLCFITGEQGKIYKISTQFGWHIVEITGKKFITNESSAKVAVLSRRVEPSKTTQQAIKDKAVAIIQQAKTIGDLEAIAKQQNVPFQNDIMVKENDFTIGVLGAGDDIRSLIRWAFDPKTKEGGVSKEVFSFGDAQGGYFDSKYVVAALKSIIPKGEASVATLKGIPDAVTRVRNLKKAGIIKSKMQNVSDLSSLAAQWDARVDTLRNANFLQTNSEPRVTGMLYATETGKISPIVVGNLGVVVLQPLTETAKQTLPADMTLFRRQLSSQASISLRTSLMKSLQRQYDVQDNRSRFW
jgi:peptidyl-prolyl cis-trans isomerase D